jgi:hypothetical protein
MIFLMCSERSGSNLLRTLLGRHSKISAPPPPHLINIFTPLLPSYGDIKQEGNFHRLVTDVSEVMNNQMGHWDSSTTPDIITNSVRERSFTEILRTVYQTEASHNNKNISFVKDNGIIHYPLHLQTMFREARFIYLVRDPRDVALSWKRSQTHTGGIVTAAKTWRHEQESALQAYAVCRELDNIKVVHYEDLIARTGDILREICCFSGLQYEDNLLEQLPSTRTIREAGTIKDWENTAKAVNRRNSGKFMRGLSTRKIRRIEQIVSREMRILGYDPVYAQHGGRIELADTGKIYRTARSSLRLLTGGTARRDELKIRIRRLKCIRKIQQLRNNSPELLQDVNAPETGNLASSSRKV